MSNGINTVTTMPQGNQTDMQHMHKHFEYPADLLKFAAWKKPEDSFEKAVELAKKKKPVLGEPVVVPFNYTHSDGTTSIEVVFAIGSLDPENPFIKCSITNDIVNEAVIVSYDTSTGDPEYTTLEDLLKTFITRAEAGEYIEGEVVNVISKEEVIGRIAENVTETEAFSRALDNRLSWKPIPRV